MNPIVEENYLHAFMMYAKTLCNHFGEHRLFEHWVNLRLMKTHETLFVPRGRNSRSQLRALHLFALMPCQINYTSFSKCICWRMAMCVWWYSRESRILDIDQKFWNVKPNVCKHSESMGMHLTVDFTTAECVQLSHCECDIAKPHSLIIIRRLHGFIPIKIWWKWTWIKRKHIHIVICELEWRREWEGRFNRDDNATTTH